MIEYACTHCSEPMSSPDSLIGRYETCPSCRRRVKVPDPAAVAERNRCSDRQLDYASSLGLKANAAMSKDELSELLTRYDRVKHYLYGLIIHLTDRTAADLGIPRQAVESLVASMVNSDDPLVGMIYDHVGPDESSSQFIRPKSELYRRVATLFVTEFGGTLSR